MCLFSAMEHVRMKIFAFAENTLHLKLDIFEKKMNEKGRLHLKLWGVEGGGPRPGQSQTARVANHTTYIS